MKITKKHFTDFLDNGFSVAPVKEISLKNGEKEVDWGYKWGHFQIDYATKQDVSTWVKDEVEGIFLITGQLSGVVVIDIDEKNQDKYPYLQDTSLRVKTPRSGGVHYYFKWSEKLEKFGPQVRIKDLPMDYRGRGGLVFVPPTEVNGKRYELVGQSDFNIDPQSLPELPKQVFEMMEDDKLENYGDEELLDRDKGSIILPKLELGERNQQTTRILGYLLAKTPSEMWDSIIWPRVVQWNQENVDPPQKLTALRATWDQITRSESLKRQKELIPETYRSSFVEILKEQLLTTTDEVFNTGYKDIDKATGGLKYSGTYLVSGLEKSGKSSWLMNMLQKQLAKKMPMGFINTELPALDFAKRMTSYDLSKPKEKITNEEIEAWSDTYGKSFEYLGIENMGSDPDEIVDAVEGFIDKGVRCLVFDNLTSWGNRMIDGRDAWQVISDMLAQIIKLTQNNNIITFFVLHVRPSAVEKTNSRMSTKQILEDPDSIFRKSTTYIKRPSLNSVYGGGAILSQISGAFFIWRPYQKISESHYQQKAMVILESMRHCKDTDVKMDFDGSRGKFLPEGQLIKGIDEK